MEKVIHSYESIYIINAALPDEEIKALIEKFNALMSTTGTLVKVDEWGKRKLAYPINDLTEGYYVRVEFNADATLPAEIERVFKITDGIIRSIIVRLDK